QFEPGDDSGYQLEVVPAHLTRRVHFFCYDRKLREILREGFDLVHAWEEPYIRAGWQISRWAAANSKLVYRSAQSISQRYPPPFSYFERHCMQRAAGWICSGTLVEQCLKSRPLYNDLPMRRAPLGVDCDVFKPNRDAARDTLRQLNWPIDGAPVVGYLG